MPLLFTYAGFLLACPKYYGTVFLHAAILDFNIGVYDPSDLDQSIYEPRHEKTCFMHCENKGADQLLWDFVFAIPLQSLYFLTPKF